MNPVLLAETSRRRRTKNQSTAQARTNGRRHGCLESRRACAGGSSIRYRVRASWVFRFGFQYGVLVSSGRRPNLCRCVAPLNVAGLLIRRSGRRAGLHLLSTAGMCHPTAKIRAETGCSQMQPRATGKGRLLPGSSGLGSVFCSPADQAIGPRK